MTPRRHFLRTAVLAAFSGVAVSNRAIAASAPRKLKKAIMLGTLGIKGTF